MKISDITVQNISARKLQGELPEFYELKDVRENNAAHKESTFAHTLNILHVYETDDDLFSPQIRKYLGQRLQNHTRKELMRLIILLHDIGKKETMIMTDGETRFP